MFYTDIPFLLLPAFLAVKNGFCQFSLSSECVKTEQNFNFISQR
jgi:hypothetical protein